MIRAWLSIGKRNTWIREAVDPEFNESSFTDCMNDETLIKMVCGPQSWCLGQAFYSGNVCLINQVDGGDEWLVIRDAQAFESFSCKAMGPDVLRDHLNRIRRATPAQLKTLDY